LGTSFGRGGATTYQQELQNSDCIIIEGSNMAECHPVGFQWVMEAKARGATLIHVDPRYTRTSALADIHVPLRAGSDIAFLGGLINYVIENDKYFRDYVVAYTNAPAILREEFRDTEDLDGLFSGFDPEQRKYDFHTWQYEGTEVQAASGQRDQAYEDQPGSERGGDDGSHLTARGESTGSGGSNIGVGEAERDETLQHPRCVFQVVKRHYARYTPQLVEEVCGVPQDLFLKVCETLTANSTRDRTSAFVYAVGWTQHTVGVQYIRAAAVLQLLLGNMGRPGGGIMALRGHASIQGSTDIPTLFNLLPGYIPMPHAHRDEDLDTFIAGESAEKGYWGNMRDYMVSLMKAYWGAAATPENDFCFDYLPRLTGSHSTYETVQAQIDGKCKGYFLLGENPAVGSANNKM
jgi:formate dehydrogenase major subunit